MESNPDPLALLLSRGVVTSAQVEECSAACGPGAAPAQVLDVLLARGYLDREELSALGLRADPSRTPTPCPDPGSVTRLDPTHPVPEKPGADSQPGAAAPAARRLGRFELLGDLGQGGMGVVYKAFDTELRRTVALKGILGGRIGLDDPQAARFRIEARAAAKLHHPGIVTVHEVGEIEGQAFLVLEFVDGTSLDQHLAARGRNLREAANLVRQAAEAIGHAHRQGVLHRDLKPENILVDSAGTARVTDFGLAREVKDPQATRITQDGIVMGTPSYMSPEQADGRTAEVGPLADVWGLGAVLYHALTGSPPFDASTIPEVLYRVVHTEPQPPRRLDTRVPGDLENICLKALAKEPSSRYASAQALADDLGRWLAGEAVEARRPGWAERSWRRVRKNPVMASLFVAAAAGLALSAWLARQRSALESETLGALRELSRTHVAATLLVRRSGGRVAAAEKEFLPSLEAAARAVMDRNPTLAEPHYHLGRMHRALMRFDQALRHQERALTCDVEYSPSRYERVVLLLRQYDKRMMELRETWRAEEGKRLGAAGLLDMGGLGGEAMRAMPGDEALAARDTVAGDLRITILEDLRRLEVAEESHGGAAGLSPGMRDCARGLVLAGTGGKQERAQACELLARAVGAMPGLEEGHEALARAAVADRDFARAVEAWSRGLEADPGYIPFWTGRASARLELAGDLDRRGESAESLYAEAIDDHGRALDLDPECVEAWRGRCEVRLWAGVTADSRGKDPLAFYELAIPDGMRALQLDAGDFQARTWVARVHSAWGSCRLNRGEDPTEQFVAAIAEFGAALELRADSVSARTDRGITQGNWAFYKQVRGENPIDAFEAAAADFGKALESDPTRWETWVYRGRTRGNWGVYLGILKQDPGPLYAAAIADFEEALKIQSGISKTWSSLGNVLVLWGIHQSESGGEPGNLFARAIDNLGRAMELDVVSSEAPLFRGNAHRAWGHHLRSHGQSAADHWQLALADYTESLRLNPRGTDALIRRGELHCSEGRWSEAVADFEAAQQVNPSLEPKLRPRRLEASLRSAVSLDTPWIAALLKGAGAAQAGDFSATRAAYENGLAALRELDATERERLERNAGVRQLLLTTHFNLACVLACASEGRERPGEPARAIDPGEASALLEQAFGHLERAIDLGWRDRKQTESVPHLASLRGDPRWPGLLERMGR